MGWAPGRRHRLALLLALSTLAAVELTAQQAPQDFEQGLFEVAVPDLPVRTITVHVSPRGRVLLPVRDILQLVGMPAEGDAGIVTVPRAPGRTGSAVLNATARTLTLDSVITLADDELLVSGTEVYLASPRLGDLLDARLEVDMGTLSISLSRDPPFPAQLRLQLESRRRLLGSRGDSTPGTRVPFDPRSGGAVLEWNVGGVSSARGIPSHLSLASGFELSGGMLRLTGTAYPTTLAGVKSQGDASASYHRVFPERQWLRQLQVGDVVTEGPLARSVRGVLLTNAPFVRGMRFGELPFSQQLPRGWEYEVYQGGQLIGFASAASDAPVMVPINYGSTPVEVRLYGPAGELRTANAVFAVPVAQLQAGTWQYSAGGGRCPRRQCELLVYGELRHGVTQTLTMSAGADHLVDSTASALSPYGAISYLPAPAWIAELQARHGSYARATVQKLDPGPLSGSASVGRQPGTRSLAGGPTFAPRWFGDLSLQTDALARALRGRSVGFSARVEGTREAGAEHWHVSTTLPLPGGHLGVGVRDDPYAQLTGAPAGRPMVSVDPFWAWTRGSPAWLGTPILRGSVGMLQGRVREWEAGVNAQPRFGNVTLSARQAPGIRATQLTLSITQTLPHARALAHLTDRGGRLDGGYAVSGAMAIESAARTHPLMSGGLGLAGMRGRVYRDVDGDGRFSDVDLPMADAAVSVGSIRVITDSTGRYHTWSVLPYEVTRIRLDTATISDPMWVPAHTEHLRRLSPHRYNEIDFPMLLTREVVGSVIAEPGVPTAAGLTIEIVAPDSQVEQQRTTTYSDGGFYIGRLRPGSYELRIATSSLEALEAVSFPVALAFTIPATAEEPVVELPALRLRSLRRAPGVAVAAAKSCPPAPAGVPRDAEGCAVLFMEQRTITLQGVTFATGQSALTPASEAVLERVASLLASDTTLLVEVAGHTDSTGSPRRNLALSAARAEAVMRFFISRGVDARRLVSRGYGSAQPLAPNDTPDGRALNRRTELRRLESLPASPTPAAVPGAPARPR